MAERKYTPISPIGKCKTCGETFAQIIGRGKWREYCSSVCRPPRAKPTKSCEVSGCANNARSSVSTHCEKHYYQIRRNGKIGTIVERGFDNCQHCGAPTDGNKWCSPRCSTRASRGLPAMRDCVSCGEAFSPINGNVACSARCLKLHKREICKARYARLSSECPAFREKVRATEYKRKALKRQAFVEEVMRDEVMRRSRWVCHLCGQKIPKAAVWPDPLFGSVDHVIPLAKGGKHSYANCKAAHLRCNCSKGAKPVGQLGLEFAA